MLQQSSIMLNTRSNTISAIVSQVRGGLQFVAITYTGNSGNTVKLLMGTVQSLNYTATLLRN